MSRLSKLISNQAATKLTISSVTTLMLIRTVLEARVRTSQSFQLLSLLRRKRKKRMKISLKNLTIRVSQLELAPNKRPLSKSTTHQAVRVALLSVEESNYCKLANLVK